MKKCCFWVLGVIQWFRANVLGELGCTCVAAHWNTLSLLCYALLSDRDRRAMSCCFIAVGQSYRVPLQASQSSLFMKLIKIAGSGPSFLPHSLCDLRWRRRLGLGKSYFVSAVSDIFSFLAVVWKLFCRALFLVFSFVSFSLALCLVRLFFFAAFVWLAKGPLCA